MAQIRKSKERVTPKYAYEQQRKHFNRSIGSLGLLGGAALLARKSNKRANPRRTPIYAQMPNFFSYLSNKTPSPNLSKSILHKLISPPPAKVLKQAKWLKRGAIASGVAGGLGFFGSHVAYRRKAKKLGLKSTDLDRLSLQHQINRDYQKKKEKYSPKKLLQRKKDSEALSRMIYGDSTKKKKK